MNKIYPCVCAARKIDLMISLMMGLMIGLSVGSLGCSGSSSSAGSNPTGKGDGIGGAWSSADAASVGPTYGSGGASGGGTAVVLPPEQEQSLDFLAPRAGARYVYVANPGRDTVTVIDSTSLAINEITTGDTPTYLATVPGQDVALVVNIGSHTLSVLRGAQMTADPVAVVPKANTISIAPDGTHAVVWFDAAQTSSTSTGTTGAAALTGSTQDVSVISLSPTGATATAMTVGYQPSAVVFSSDGAAAFVVTSDGISSLRFAQITGPAIAPLTRIDNKSAATLLHPDAGASDALVGEGGIQSPANDSGTSGPAIDGGTAPDLGKDGSLTTVPAGTGKPVDVSVTRDGHYAIARRDGTAELLLVDLTTNKVTSIQLSSPITDLDMTPSGDQAFAVLRDEGKLVRVDIPTGFTDTTHQTSWQFANETIGSVTLSTQGSYAIVYTTAVSIKRMVILDLRPSAGAATQAVELQKYIRAIAIAPDEKTALVLHTKSSGSPTATGLDLTTQLDRSYGYTLVSLADGFAKLLVTPADPNPFTITPNSEYAFVLLRDDAASVRLAERISLTSFQVDDFPLGSPPSSIAALSTDSHRVFIGQVHPEGRISFIDWTNGNVNSVTGFALNGRIQQ
jgi:hypothetical protein